MSQEDSNATTTYPDIESFENNEAEDNKNNHDIQITPNLGSPQTQSVVQPEQSNNKINNTATIKISDKVFKLEGLYKKESKSIATLAKAVKSLARQMPATKPKSKKEKGIAQPVEVAQVAVAVILQGHHLKKEELKNRKDLLHILLKPTQMLKFIC